MYCKLVYWFLSVKLSPHTSYIFYVRAWYSEDEFALFTSDGIQIDGTSPELSRSKVLKELQSTTSSKDIDFLKQSSTVTLTWDGVFRDSQSDIVEYIVYIGTNKGAKNVYRNSYNGNVTTTTITGLNLLENQDYHTTVTAVNKAGLSSISHSDGFIVGLHLYLSCCIHIL